MKTEDRDAIERFAREMLGQRGAASIETITIEKRGVDLDQLSALIADYRTLPDDQQHFTFESRWQMPTDPRRYHVFITRK